MTQARIIVREPNGVQRTLPLTPRGLTIGRGTDNNLVINYPTTSRYHAQVTTDGFEYYVTDLNSGNGSYLGDTRLAPNQLTPWPQGLPLQIGDVLIYLEEGAQQPGQQPQQPQKGRKKDRQKTETIVGWAPPAEQKKPGASLWTMILLAGLAVVCICAALGAAGYLLFYQ